MSDEIVMSPELVESLNNRLKDAQERLELATREVRWLSRRLEAARFLLTELSKEPARKDTA